MPNYKLHFCRWRLLLREVPCCGSNSRIKCKISLFLQRKKNTFLTEFSNICDFCFYDSCSNSFVKYCTLIDFMDVQNDAFLPSLTDLKPLTLASWLASNPASMSDYSPSCHLFSCNLETRLLMQLLEPASNSSGLLMYPVEIYLGQGFIFFWPVMVYTCLQLQPAHRSDQLWLQAITADSARLYADVIYRVVFMNLCYCFLHTHSDSEIIQSAYRGGETGIVSFLERHCELGNLPQGAERGGLCRSVKNLNYRFGSALNSNYKIKQWLSLKVVRLFSHLLIFTGDIFTHELWRMSGLSGGMGTRSTRRGGGLRYTLQLPEQAGGSACCEFTWQSPVLLSAHFKDHWKVAARLSIIFGKVQSCRARGWWRRTNLSHFKCCLRTSRSSFGVVFKISSNFSVARFFTVFSTLLLSAVNRLRLTSSFL